MSSESEGDDDYVPEAPEKLSEEDSADEETNLQYENEVEHKNKRKTNKVVKAKKKMKTANGTKEVINKNIDLEEEAVNSATKPEDEKKREDDLWAKFLEGTETKPKTVKESNNTQPQPTKLNDVLSNKLQSSANSKANEDEKNREQRIFEFAGETIVVENNVIKEKIKLSDSPASVSKLQAPISRSRGGLSGVLNQMNKKNTLSTLEKSKLDWDTFKKEEGIEEEIVSHNKGKAGYLERQDFLDRSDLRQYELEREVRLSRRTKR